LRYEKLFLGFLYFLELAIVTETQIHTTAYFYRTDSFVTVKGPT